MVGQTISNYKILEKLGQGGMGSVFKAQDVRLDRFAVLKFLQPHISQDEGAKERFVQEAKAASALDHPNVCTIYEIGDAPDGQTFIAMAYYQGETLKEKIARGPLPFDEIIDIVTQIAQGLLKAHRKSILHRDIKPANIMVTHEGVAKILDFGLAKLSQSPELTKPGTVVGTPYYMAPEQLLGGKVDQRTDIWALGVLMYEAVTGKLPFNGEYQAAIGYAITSEEPTPVSELRPDTPGLLVAVIEKALSKNQERRYQGLDELIFDLQDEDAAKTAVVGLGLPHPAGAPAKTGAPSQTPGPEPEGPKSSPGPTMAYVLFMDLVAYSRKTIEERVELAGRLTSLVQQTATYRKAKAAGEIISLPTGDGMALVFFNRPVAPVECTVQLSSLLKAHPEIKLRMGIHAGFVIPTTDINEARNVAGGGIDMAQRVMDSGDEGHILLSASVGDVLRDLGEYRNHLHDLGEHEVKHGVKIRLVNLYSETFGNPELPSKLKAPKAEPSGEKKLPSLVIPAAVVLLAIIGALGWPSLRCAFSPESAGCVAAPPVEPAAIQSTLRYWITLQRYRDGQPYGNPIRLAREYVFEEGYRIFVHMSSPQNGFLYIVNEGPEPRAGLPVYNILFPTTAFNGGKAAVGAESEIQLPQSGGFVFDAESGTERLWFVWAKEPVAELEAIGPANAQNLGEVSGDEQRSLIQKFLAGFDVSKVKVELNENEKLTLLQSAQPVLVHRISLEHAPAAASGAPLKPETPPI